MGTATIVITGIVLLALVAGILLVGWLLRKSFNFPKAQSFRGRFRGRSSMATLGILVLGGFTIWLFWDTMHEKWQAGYIFGFLLALLCITLAYLASRYDLVKIGSGIMTIALFVVLYWGLADKSGYPGASDDGESQLLLAISEELPSCTRNDTEEFTPGQRYRFASDCDLAFVNVTVGWRYGALTADGEVVDTDNLFTSDPDFRVAGKTSQRLIPTEALEASGAEYIFVYPDNATRAAYAAEAHGNPAIT